jgi:hypothetical protein
LPFTLDLDAVSRDLRRSDGEDPGRISETVSERGDKANLDGRSWTVDRSAFGLTDDRAFGRFGKNMMGTRVKGEQDVITAYHEMMVGKTRAFSFLICRAPVTSLKRLVASIFEIQAVAPSDIAEGEYEVFEGI